MIRFLAYILLFFIAFRAVGYLLRLVIGSDNQKYPRNQPKKSNPSSKSGVKKTKGYQGGEYVDYEEVE